MRIFAFIAFGALLFPSPFFVLADESVCEPDSIEINTASKEELKFLDGIGEALSEKIIENRPFEALDELETKVSGIGPVTLQKIKDQGCAWIDTDLLATDEDSQEEEPAESPEDIQAGPPESSEAGFGGEGQEESPSPDIPAAIAKALEFLQNQEISPDIAMALGASEKSMDVSFLKSFSGDSAISYAKPMLAITAAGHDPRSFPDEDWVAKMKSFADDIQFGDPSLANDDIWGILALRSAGVLAEDSVIQNSKTFLLENQNADGGWSWQAGGSSDTNDTAAAIMALLEAGMRKGDTPIESAISYLKAAQNLDGGFPYDPVSPFGTDSDGNSTAWVVMAINKLGEDPTSSDWTKNPNPVDFLLSLQDEDGGFWWMAPGISEWNNKGATADALIALSGKSFPIHSIAVQLAVPQDRDASEENGKVSGGVGMSAPVQMSIQGEEEKIVSEQEIRAQMAKQLEEIAREVEEMEKQVEALVAVRVAALLEAREEKIAEKIPGEALAGVEEEDFAPAQEREGSSFSVLSEESPAVHLRAEAASTGFAEFFRSNSLLLSALSTIGVIFGVGLYRFRFSRRMKRSPL